MDIDLSSMSRNELNALKARIEKELVSAEMRELRDARKAAERAAAEFGFSLSEVTEGAGRAARGKSIAAPKYADPSNPSNTWTGKGRQPGWFKAALSAGTDPSALEI